MGIFWAWFFHEVVGWITEVAAALSMVLVSAQNFLFFLFWVYKPQNPQDLRSMVFSFALSVVGFRGLEFLLFLVVHTWLGVHYLLALVGLRGFLMVVKFFFYRATMFADRTEEVPA